MRNIFTKHPRAMNETYLEHLMCATKFGFNMTVGGIACLLHAIFPFIFINTGSDMLYKLMREYVSRLPQMESRAEELSQLMLQKKKSTKEMAEKVYG